MAYSPSEMIWGSEGHHLSLAERKEPALLAGGGGLLWKSAQLGVFKNLLLLFYVCMCAGTQEEWRGFRTLQAGVTGGCKPSAEVLEVQLWSALRC